MERVITKPDHKAIKDSIEEAYGRIIDLEERLSEEKKFRAEIDSVFDLQAQLKDLKQVVQLKLEAIEPRVSQINMFESQLATMLKSNDDLADKLQRSGDRGGETFYS